MELIPALQTRKLTQGQAPLIDLPVSQTLSRDVEAYRAPSSVSRAAQQLMKQEKHIQPGMRLRSHYTRGAEK
jgi:DNA polymerase elongation subunit (family B)